MKTLVLGTGIIGTIYDAMFRTADELGFDMPNLKAVGVHLYGLQNRRRNTR